MQWLACWTGPKFLHPIKAVANQVGAFNRALSHLHTQLHSVTPVRGEGLPTVVAVAGLLRLKGTVLPLAVCSRSPAILLQPWLSPWALAGGRPLQLSKWKVGEAPALLQGWDELFLQGSACLGQRVGQGGRQNKEENCRTSNCVKETESLFTQQGLRFCDPLLKPQGSGDED